MNCNDANTICVIPTNQYDANIAMGWQFVLIALIIAAAIMVVTFIYFNSRADWLAEKNRQAEIRDRAKSKKVENA